MPTILCPVESLVTLNIWSEFKVNRIMILELYYFVLLRNIRSEDLVGA